MYNPYRPIKLSNQIDYAHEYNQSIHYAIYTFCFILLCRLYSIISVPSSGPRSVTVKSKERQVQRIKRNSHIEKLDDKEFHVKSRRNYIKKQTSKTLTVLWKHCGVRLRLQAACRLNGSLSSGEKRLASRSPTQRSQRFNNRAGYPSWYK